MRNAISLSLLLLTLPAAVSTGADVPQRGYSVLPLKDPLFDEAQVVVETMALNNWLSSNIRNLSFEQMKEPREQLYYLIDSRVKQIYAAEGQVLPRAPDPTLEILFRWPEYLGVFGGAQTYNAVKAPDSKPISRGMELPKGVALTLNEDLLSVHSDFGWSLEVPYYFMIWAVGDFTANGGPRTQVVTISTGAAKDKSEAGHSQATLMFLYSPEPGFAAFEKHWAGLFGVDTASAPISLGVRNFRSYRALDEATKIHTEFTSWTEDSGNYAVAYSGIEGTYEWNRPHFLDFIRSIKVTKSRSNNALQSDSSRPEGSDRC
jgi:hypothetical protein